MVRHQGTNFSWYGLHDALRKKKLNLLQFNCYFNSITAQSLSCHFPELDLRYLRYYRHRSCHSPPPLADLLKESIGLFALFITALTYNILKIIHHRGLMVRFHFSFLLYIENNYVSTICKKISPLWPHRKHRQLLTLT